jgi:DNA-binding response OmpR family regulator
MDILVVSLEAGRLQALFDPLVHAGDRVQAASSIETADAALRSGRFDCIVLDLIGEADAELAWMRGLREGRTPVAILTQTAGGDVDTRLAAIDRGGDDHVILPVDPRELVARCHSLAQRRAEGSRPETVQLGNIVVDGRRREVRHGSMPIDLTPREWAIFEFLVAHAGSAVPKERLLRAVTGWEEKLALNAIEVYVSRLRGKLSGTGARIQTIRGVGYRFEPSPDGAAIQHFA